MLKDLSKSLISSAITLAAILIMSVEMPLVHPASHAHLKRAHNHQCEMEHSGPCEDDKTAGAYLPPFQLAVKADHDCPICQFLAASSFHAVKPGPVFIAGDASGPATLPAQPLLSTAVSTHVEPRAPPVTFS